MHFHSVFRLVTASAAALAITLFLSQGAHAQSTWNTNAGGGAGFSGNWSTGSNWSGNSVPTSGTVQINSATTSQIVTYDPLTTTTLGSLSITETTSSVTNQLQFPALPSSPNTTLLSVTNISLVASNGGSALISSTGTNLFASTGQTTTFVNVAATNGLTITADGAGSVAGFVFGAGYTNNTFNSGDTVKLLNLGGSSASNLTLGASNGGLAELIFKTGVSTSSPAVTDLNLNGGTLTLNSGSLVQIGDPNNSTSSGETIGGVTGAVAINGGTFETLASTVTGGARLTVLTVNKGLTLTSGSLLLDSSAVANQAYTRLSITGGAFTATGGTISQNGTFTTGGYIDLGNGLTNTIGISGSANAVTLVNNPTFALTAANDVLLSYEPLNYIFARANGTVTLTLLTGNGNTASTALGTPNIGTLDLSPGGTAVSTILKLGSNLMSTNGASLPSSSQTATGTSTIDLNGFTYDGSLVTASSGVWTPSSGNGGSSEAWAIINSNPNSTAGEDSFVAQGFNLTNASTNSITVGSNVILKAVTSGLTNNLSLYGTGGTVHAGTFDPTSTFYYTGTGGTGYLTTQRGATSTNTVIGKMTVGNGSAASNLKLLSQVTTAGNTLVSSNSVLDLNGLGLILGNNGSTVGASLFGSGTITNSGAATSITFTGGATTKGGLNPGDSGVGTLTLAPGAGLTLDLTGASSSFDVASTSSYDVLNMGGSGSILNLGSSVLTLNFTYTPVANDAFNLVTNLGTINGSFSSITSNISGDTFSFNDTTGILTVVSAVPEPSAFQFLALSLFCSTFGFWRRGVLSARVRS